MFEFMRAFRETFSRPVKRIRFLGLFDTVNSVPRFESAWMRRSQFPYTARSSAKVIRHAVSIDERRAKFRQDLISQDKITKRHHGFPHHRPRHIASNERRARPDVPKPSEVSVADGFDSNVFRRPSQALPKIALTGASDRDITDSLAKDKEQGDTSARSVDNASNREVASMDTNRSQISLQLSRHGDESDFDGGTEQDIEEVWFPGCHADIGGGWSLADGEEYALSHGPLVWMVREAQKAGLPFDPEKMLELKCCEDHIYPFPGNDDISASQLTEKPPAKDISANSPQCSNIGADARLPPSQQRHTKEFRLVLENHGVSTLPPHGPSARRVLEVDTMAVAQRRSQRHSARCENPPQCAETNGGRRELPSGEPDCRRWRKRCAEGTKAPRNWGVGCAERGRGSHRGGACKKEGSQRSRHVVISNCRPGF